VLSFNNQKQSNTMTATATPKATTNGQRQPELLPVNLKRYGYELQQLQRNEHAAVYSVTDIETQQAHGFEVFEIRIQQARIMANGIHFAHKEVYPNNEAFGNWAKAPRTLDRALQVFNEYTERGRKRTEKTACKAELAMINSDTPEWMN
jgi:hypothetical protein